MSGAGPSVLRDATGLSKEATAHRTPRRAARLCRAGIRPATKPPWRSQYRHIAMRASRRIDRGAWSWWVVPWPATCPDPESGGADRPQSGGVEPRPFGLTIGDDAGIEPATSAIQRGALPIELIVDQTPPAEPVSRNTPTRGGSVSTDGGAWQRTRRGSNPPTAHGVRGPPGVGVHRNHRASADVRERQGRGP